MNSRERLPAVAGRFYPDDPAVLLREITSYLSPDEQPAPALGCMVPHAGYVYSGHVAGAVFAKLKLPRQVIILCPNHTGRGAALSIMGAGSWKTPLGSVPIDNQLAEDLKRRFEPLTEDTEAHAREHAIEVELPFLQARRDFTLVPIALGTDRFDVLEDLGKMIAETIRVQNEAILIVASSDMDHYESDALTRVKDHKAIDRILALDTVGLCDVVKKEKISMCGYGPTIAMLTAVKSLGATSGELVKYATSGDVSGDRDRVVGYAGIIVR
jgi:AmmeMemoRadiSam system protein B